MPPSPQLKPYQKKILTLMLQQETLLSSLYQTFAQKFPKHEEFWNKLAKEEKKHAGWVEQLCAATEKNIVLFSEGRVTSYTLETFIKGLEEKLNRAQADGFDARQAIVCTIDLERCLLEKAIFSHFDGLTEKASNVMKFLAKETKEHQELAEQLYAKIQEESSHQ